MEGGKPENPEKSPRSKDENQQQTQPTCDAVSGNRTRATAVRGERFHHGAIPAPRASILAVWIQFKSQKTKLYSNIILMKPKEWLKKLLILLLHVPTDHFMSAVKNFSNAASTFNDWLKAVDQNK